MSSLGRPSNNIDLNTGTISAIEELRERVDILEDEVGDEKTIEPYNPATGLFLRIDDIENNLGVPSQNELTNGEGDIIEAQTDATGLNLDVETLQTDTDKLQEQVGDDDIDPKTGIFLRLFDIEKADTIIPHYERRIDYFKLLNELSETITPSDNANTININNVDGSNLNSILLELIQDVRVGRANTDLMRTMIKQVGYGLGATCITAPITSWISFNTRSLAGAGFDTGVIPDFIETPTDQIAITMINFMQELLGTLFEPIKLIAQEAFGFSLDTDLFIDNLLLAQNPAEFAESLLLSRVYVSADGDLYVKDPDYAKIQSGNITVDSEVVAPYLNVHQMCKKAKQFGVKDNDVIKQIERNPLLPEPAQSSDVGKIYLDYNILHLTRNTTTNKLELKYPILDVEDYFRVDSSSKTLSLLYWGNHFKITPNTVAGTTTQNFTLRLKPNGGLTDDTNGVFLKKYDNHFDIPTSGVDANKLKLRLKANGAITNDTNGVFLNIYNNDFDIPTTGVDANKLKLRLPNDGVFFTNSTGLQIRTDNQTIEKVNTSASEITKHLKVKLKLNGGIANDTNGVYVKIKSLKGLNIDANGLFIDYYGGHFRSGPTEVGEEGIPEASNKLRLKIDEDGGIDEGTNGLKINIDTDNFVIPTTGTKEGKLQLKLHEGSSLFSSPTGLFIRTDNQTIEKVATSSGSTTKHLAIKTKANGGITSDANGLFVKLKTGGGLTYDTSSTSGLKITDKYFDTDYHPKITTITNTTSTALVNSTISFNTAKTQLTFTEGSKAKQYRDEAEGFKNQANTAKTDAQTAKNNAEKAETSAITAKNNASTSATTATTQAGNASTSATTATTQAGIATAQAVIATTQAGIATTQAGIAVVAAALAVGTGGIGAIITAIDTAGTDGTIQLNAYTEPLQVINNTLTLAYNHNRLKIDNYGRLDLGEKFSSLIDWNTQSTEADTKLKVYIVGLSGKGPIDLQNRVLAFQGGSDFSSLVIANREGAPTSAINYDIGNNAPTHYHHYRFGYNTAFVADNFLPVFTDNTKYSFNFWTKVSDYQLAKQDGYFVFEETIFHTAPSQDDGVGEEDFGIKLAFDFERHQPNKIQFRVYVRYLNSSGTVFNTEYYSNWKRADGSTGYLHYDANEAKNWHNYHFEITTTGIKLYVDGTLLGYVDLSFHSISNTQQHIFMGYNQAYYANTKQHKTKRYWSSVIADFKIYNDVLSQQEITNVYNQTENYQGDGKIYGDKLKINESHFGVDDNNKQLYLKTGSHLPKGDTGIGISSTSYDANTDKLTITYTNENTDEISGLKGGKGDKGDDGNDGNGISYTSYNSATGQLTITFTSGLSYTTGNLKGSKGDDGNDGKGISSTSYDANTDKLTITYTNADTDEISGLKGGKGDTGKGISSTSYNSDTDTLTITYTDEATDALTGLKGPKGDKGDDGNGNDGKGISSTSYNSTSDTLTITYTDETTNTLTGLKGPKGDDGDVGDTGKGISYTSYNSATDTLTITYTDETTNTLTGLKGPTGNDGNGISSSSTSYNSATDTLTITFTDGTTNDIQGLKGTDGTDGNGITSVELDPNTNLFTFTRDDASTIQTTQPFTIPNGGGSADLSAITVEQNGLTKLDYEKIKKPNVEITGGDTVNPTTTVAPQTIPGTTEYKTLTFTNTDLVYDFTPHNDLASWNAYATSIGATYYNTSFAQGGIYHHPGNGWIQLVLPNGYDYVSVFYGNPHIGGTTILYIDGIQKSTCSAGITTTYSQSITGGQTLKILESSGIIHPDLKITLSQSQTPYTLTFDNPTECDILIVGGGGGGGSPDGGGGGAGGLIYSTFIELNGTYTVKVGNGGVGGKYPNGNPGQKGSNSEITGGEINLIAIGGGGGGQGYPTDTEPSPAGGGSSGGLASTDTNRDALNVHTPGQGNSGGLGDATRGGGGGGGAGASGNNGGSGTSNGLGGDGLQIDITGTNIFYAGGGGGGHAPSDTDKIGGQGGGGLGKGRGDGHDGEPNTGGGGGGGGAGGGNGGHGGSGIVIIVIRLQHQ